MVGSCPSLFLLGKGGLRRSRRTGWVFLPHPSPFLFSEMGRGSRLGRFNLNLNGVGPLIFPAKKIGTGKDSKIVRLNLHQNGVGPLTNVYSLNTNTFHCMSLADPLYPPTFKAKPILKLKK